MTEWQPIETIPYDTSVLVLWSDGKISQDFLYDQTLEEWRAERKRKPFHDGDPIVIPEFWSEEPRMPEAPS